MNGISKRTRRLFALSLVISTAALPVRAQSPAPTGSPLLEQLQQAYESLGDRVAPAVVAIRAVREPAQPSGAPDDKAAAWASTGSGVIIRADGMILTSEHVIENALSIDVVTEDGRRFRARRVAADDRSDIAVIQVRASGLPAAMIGDVRGLRRGHIVLALGHPDGAIGDGRAAISSGIVSGIGHSSSRIDRSVIPNRGDLILFSAVVGPGNSGGPLIDIHGRVVGLVTARGIDSGTGIALPFDERSRSVVERLLAGESIEYGCVGAEFAPAPGMDVSADGATPGAWIAALAPNGPAECAGLRVGDVITYVAGQLISSGCDLLAMLRDMETGRVLSVAYVREGRRRSTTIALAPCASTASLTEQPQSIAFRGAVMASVDRRFRAYANLPRHALLVRLVGTDTPAHRAGLTPGDVIVRVEGSSITSKTVASLNNNADGDVLLGLTNGGSVLVKGP